MHGEAVLSTWGAVSTECMWECTDCMGAELSAWWAVLSSWGAVCPKCMWAVMCS